MVTSCLETCSEEIRIGNGLQLQHEGMFPHQQGCTYLSQWLRNTVESSSCAEVKAPDPRERRSLLKMEKVTKEVGQRKGMGGKLTERDATIEHKMEEGIEE